MARYDSYFYKWTLDAPPGPSTPFDLRPYLSKSYQNNKPNAYNLRKSKAFSMVPEAQKALQGLLRPARKTAQQQQYKQTRGASESNSPVHDSNDDATTTTTTTDTDPQARGFLPPMTMYPMQMAYKEVADEINRWLAKHKQGYGIVIQRSNKTSVGNLRSVTLGCDRGGEYRNSHRVTEQDRKRRYTRPTRKVSCPFRFQIRPGDGGSWEATMVSDVHNHPLSEDVAEHAKQRHLFLSPEIRDEIIAIFNEKVPARKVLQELAKKYGDIPIRRKDLYNLKRTVPVKSQLDGSASQSPGPWWS